MNLSEIKQARDSVNLSLKNLTAKGPDDLDSAFKSNQPPHVIDKKILRYD